MKIELAWISIRNFKGIKSFDQRFDGNNATITARNGKGKTSIYDAELWLFFGKDSEDRTDFDIIRLDRFNQPVKGLTITVEAGIIINGEQHVFKKVQTENTTKTGKIIGYAKDMWIDEAPKLLKEYNAYIEEEITTEEIFKLVTNLRYFNELHHSKKRNFLMKMAGDDITVPEGFEELLKAQGNVPTLDEFKKVLRDRKAADNKEKDGINPRIDEIFRNMAHPKFDVKEQEKARELVKNDLFIIKTKRQKLRSIENERESKNEKINLLVRQRTEREGELKNDKSSVQDLFDKKRKTTEELNKLFDCTNESIKALRNVNADKETAKAEESIILGKLSDIRGEIRGYESHKVIDTCTFCKQKLPAGEINASKKRLKVKLEELNKDADVLMAELTKSEALVEELSKKVKAAQDLVEENRKAYAKIEAITKKGNAEIDEKIKTAPTPPPEKDDLWLAICKDIKNIEDDLGDPVTDQLNKLDSEQEASQAELDKITELFAQADRLEDDKKRIEELKADEVRLGQNIANSEKLLNDIELYKAEESQMITSSVNGLFKYTKFKMFKEFLGSDDIKECCVPTYNGTPYAGCSTGEKIRVGIDEVNAFSKFYDFSAPLFIDRAESMTFPIESTCQTIQLIAKKSVEELEVKIAG